MKDPFETLPCRWILKHEPAHPYPIEATVSRNKLRPECPADFCDRRLVWTGQCARNFVSIHNVCAVRCEHLCNCCLARADASRQPDSERHCSEELQVSAIDRFTPEQGYQPGGRKVRSKGDGGIAATSGEDDQCDANNRTHQR